MAKARNFFLRTTKQSGKASLWVRVQRKSDGINWWINTGIMVNIDAWNKAQQSAAKFKEYIDTAEGKRVNDKTDKVLQTINLIMDSVEGKETLQKEVQKVANADAVHELEDTRKRESEEKKRQLHIIWNYYNVFFEGISSGRTLQKGGTKEYTPESIRVWRNFGRLVKTYVPQEMTFEEIDRRFADSFRTHLAKDEGLMISTVNKYIICMRRLCGAAADDGFNDNFNSTRVWGEREAADSEKRAAIALSDSEVNAIYDMPLTGIREKVRDIWMMGYLSGQRVSDFTRLTCDNFKTTPNGTDIIVLRQQKTGSEVIVPVMDERVDELCQKYNYEFPQVDPRTINRYLKEICHTLSKEVLSFRELIVTELTGAEKRMEDWFVETAKRVESGEVLHGDDRQRFKELKEYAEAHNSGNMLWRRNYAGKVVREKWEMVTTHTARRSMTTSLYDTQLFDNKEIMSITGHKTIKNFERYIKRGAIQQADRIAEKVAKAKEKKLKKQA